jgi:hypothetical protein
MTHPAHLDRPRGYPGLVQLIALELAGYPNRIKHALETIADARSPLRATSYETGSHNSHGPDPGQTELARQADHDRQTLTQTIRDLDTACRTIRAICNEWAPNPAKPDLSMWCENHLRHGYREPRASDGSRNCRWCCQFHRDPPHGYGVWPNRALLEHHARYPRISVTEVRRLLGKRKGAA